MRRKTQVWLLIGTFLTVLGLVLFLVGVDQNTWDDAKRSTAEYETNIYEFDERFKDISVQADTADILFFPSENEMCKIICHKQKKVKHNAFVQNETLSVVVSDTRKWYEKITFLSLDSSYIEIYLPKTKYEKLAAECSTGDVELPKEFEFQNIEISASTGNILCFASAENTVQLSVSTGTVYADGIRAGMVSLSATTGDVLLKNLVCDGEMQINVSTGRVDLEIVRCGTLVSEGSTGDISFAYTTVDEKLSVVRSTGDVRFENADAAEIFIETSTGDVEGSLLSEKVFFTESDTGTINVPKTMAGGKCEIKTDTGNIEIEIAK